MNMNNYKVVFLEWISKIPADINKDVEDNYQEVSTFDFSIEPNEIVEFLKRK